MGFSRRWPTSGHGINYLNREVETLGQVSFHSLRRAIDQPLEDLSLSRVSSSLAQVFLPEVLGSNPHGRVGSGSLQCVCGPLCLSRRRFGLGVNKLGETEPETQRQWPES